MNIIQKQPNPGGAYPPIQSWQGETPPDGYYEITAGTSEFFNGFITPTVEDGIVTSLACNTDAWNAWKATQPKPLSPLEQARADALERISGKCSAAIYAGMDVTPSTTRGKHHYSFPKLAQDDINQIMTSIAVNGETVFSYKADDESLNLYTADEIKLLSKSLKTLCTACTKYKEELETWIARETDKAVLVGIDFGIKLPDDLTKDLIDYLTSLSIDTSILSMLK